MKLGTQLHQNVCGEKQIATALQEGTLRTHGTRTDSEPCQVTDPVQTFEAAWRQMKS